MGTAASAPEVTAFAPGTLSNVGSGFDCFGIALDGLGDHVTAVARDEPGVVVARISDPRIPTTPERNTAAIAAAAVLRIAGVSDRGATLSIEKGLPLAGGLGGSAASAVAGAVATNALFGLGLTTDALLEAALEAEAAVAGQHPDNVVPALLGGAVVIAGAEPRCLVPVRVSPGIAFVIVMPGYAVETAAARAMLPSDVPRGVAVAQAAHFATLVLGLERGDGRFIAFGTRDHVAEPARAALFPGFVEARSAALGAGAFGVAISGAGPTAVAICPEEHAGAVCRALESGYGRAGITASAEMRRVDLRGARIVR